MRPVPSTFLLASPYKFWNLNANNLSLDQLMRYVKDAIDNRSRPYKNEPMKSKRMALNRGTAVYLDGSRVRFIWPCGCTKVETMHMGRKSNSPVISPVVLRDKLVPYWRRTGVTLPECKKHPEWYSPASQVNRLNLEYPQ